MNLFHFIQGLLRMFKQLLLPILSFEVKKRHLKLKKHYSALYHFFLLYPTMEENLLGCGIQRRSFFCGVGYNGRKTPALWDTTQKNLLRCIPLRYITYYVMGYNAGKITNHHQIILSFIPHRVSCEMDFFSFGLNRNKPKH
jgi:hypothetical protein